MRCSVLCWDRCCSRVACLGSINIVPCTVGIPRCKLPIRFPRKDSSVHWTRSSALFCLPSRSSILFFHTSSLSLATQRRAHQVSASIWHRNETLRPATCLQYPRCAPKRHRRTARGPPSGVLPGVPPGVRGGRLGDLRSSMLGIWEQGIHDCTNAGWDRRGLR